MAPGESAALAVCDQLDTVPRTERELIRLAQLRCPQRLKGTRYETMDRVACPRLRNLALAGQVHVVGAHLPYSQRRYHL
jgi:hypothetical protein